MLSFLKIYSICVVIVISLSIIFLPYPTTVSGTITGINNSYTSGTTTYTNYTVTYKSYTTYFMSTCSYFTVNSTIPVGYREPLSKIYQYITVDESSFPAGC